MGDDLLAFQAVGEVDEVDREREEDLLEGERRSIGVEFQTELQGCKMLV
jgi:hypothetical protein